LAQPGLPCEFRVGNGPQPRLAGAVLILADSADHTALENGDASVPGALSGKVRRQVMLVAFIAVAFMARLPAGPQ
jgi:hypothetical protein